ncbi:hypothetical protein EZV73_17100 [Acidaminobacter sp. JC074]|uniref:hypothetical protein n=1 Tax=Acidaminobacter sp. JC074 TaxID=2530199 RepID=UPI001F111690|nr:hypothetical protein [Acidaminobacter sp. JC074]MCH4889318.1 hypothetical protein [Acidaminobacter sp. JC074]
MPNLIHLKDYSRVYERDEHKFIKAESTKSRLMGVIGIKLYFENMILYFHLDFEEYGFDRFEVTVKASDEGAMTASVMGGLGAGFVQITKSEATALIYRAIEVGQIYAYDIPLDFFDYEYLLDEEVLEIDHDLHYKISEPIDSDLMLINYYMMRTAGLDHIYKKKVLQAGDFDYEFLDEPTVLLKNEIIPYEGDYICRSIIDFFDAYKMIVTKVRVRDHKVVSCDLIEDLVMSPREASFQLNKKEYIGMFYLESSKAFRFDFERPEMMKNSYDSGTLYTVFNKDNDHVKEDVYYLNGDVYGSYFITDNQLVVTCFKHEQLMKIKNDLKIQYGLDEIAELEAENPILNQFITSGYTDFFKFLGE